MNVTEITAKSKEENIIIRLAAIAVCQAILRISCTPSPHKSDTTRIMSESIPNTNWWIYMQMKV